MTTLLLQNDEQRECVRVDYRGEDLSVNFIIHGSHDSCLLIRRGTRRRGRRTRRPTCRRCPRCRRHRGAGTHPAGAVAPIPSLQMKMRFYYVQSYYIRNSELFEKHLWYASHLNDEAFRDTMNHKLPKFSMLAQTEDTEHYLSSTYDLINLVFHDFQ